ncbi:MAG: carbon monoxide dehydrogenase [Nitrospinota bacterium]
MGLTIAVAGKGGSGKTTATALFARYLIEVEGKAPLIIDADPNMNLNLLLGLPAPRGIGELREEVLAGSLPSGMSKEEYLSYMVDSSLLEEDGFDFLAMGRPEGKGCYCFANHIVRRTLDRLTASYEATLIDNEAGLEHISRCTNERVDLMLLISDPSPRGVQAAGRIRALTHELKHGVGRMGLILNRVSPGGEERELLRPAVDEAGLSLLGTIPQDPLITEFEMEGRSLLALPPNAPSLVAAWEIMGSALRGASVTTLGEAHGT